MIGQLRPRSASSRADAYIARDGGYDAARYWGDRHRQHLHSFRGVGDLSLTEAQNVADYVAATNVMASLLQSVACNPRGKSMLDIGCGNGFWAGVFAKWGISTYTGVDIVDTLFPLLRKRYPGFHFTAGDLPDIQVDGPYELITIIDVTQHIVDDSRLERMLGRARSLMAKKGVLIVTFWNQARAQENFYETFRLFEFYTRALSGLSHTAPMRFRDKFVAAFYEPQRHPDRLPLQPLSNASVSEIAEQILRT